MPYRMPPPWDPGYALPANVKDEGLQRRAFVTKQARRGTYDDPKVGSGGYVLPQYVKDEGYGQGVLTTAWSPSGSTPGVHVPHYLNQRPQLVGAQPAPGGGTTFTVSRHSTPATAPGVSAVAFGDIPIGHPAVPAVYRRYGQRAATVLMQNASRVHPTRRGAEMKKALDAIDPKIFPRAMKATQAYQAQTGRKGGQAVHAGLSHAISTTLLEQVIETGRTGKAPRSGLMSLARGRRSSPAALGAVPIAKVANLMSSGAFLKLLPNAQSGPGGISPGTCSASGEFVWDAGGFWRRLMAGEQCGSIDPNIASPSTGGAPGGVTITQGLPGAGGKIVSGVKLAPTIAPGTTKLITVGPFTFPLVDHMTIHWSGLLPADWRAAINQQITRDCSPCISSSMRDASPGTPLGLLRAFLGPEMPTKINHDFFGINPGGNVITSSLDPATAALVKQMTNTLRSPTQPLAKTVRPDTGDTYALYATLEPRDISKPANATTNPWNLRIQWREADSSVWGWIWSVVSTIGDWAADAIDAIGSLTCDILGNPAGKVAVVAGGAAVGGAGGAQAGAAGAAIGSQICAQPPPPQQTVDTGSSLLPLAILGAGAVAAVALFSKRKKKTP